MKFDCKCVLNCTAALWLLVLAVVYVYTEVCDKKIIEDETFFNLAEYKDLSETIHNDSSLRRNLKKNHNNLALKLNTMIDLTIIYHQPFDKKMLSALKVEVEQLKNQAEHKEKEGMLNEGWPPFVGLPEKVFWEKIKEIFETQRKTFNETLKEYKWRLIY